MSEKVVGQVCDLPSFNGKSQICPTARLSQGDFEVVGQVCDLLTANRRFALQQKGGKEFGVVYKDIRMAVEILDDLDGQAGMCLDAAHKIFHRCTKYNLSRFAW